MEFGPVVALGNRRPQRLHLIDQHRARDGTGEVRMLEIDRVRWLIWRQRDAHRLERVARIRARNRTTVGALAAQCTAAPVEPELLVADLALLEESKDPHHELRVLLIATGDQTQTS